MRLPFLIIVASTNRTTVPVPMLHASDNCPPRLCWDTCVLLTRIFITVWHYCGWISEIRRLISSFKAWMVVVFFAINFWLQKLPEKNILGKKKGLSCMLNCQSTTAKISTNSNYPLVTCLLKLCKATCCTTYCGSRDNSASASQNWSGRTSKNWSGRIGKMVASHAAVARSIPA